MVIKDYQIRKYHLKHKHTLTYRIPQNIRNN